MRYLIQFGVPLLIFLGVVYTVARQRKPAGSEQESGAGMFLTILVIGAVIAVAVMFILQVNWEGL